MSDPFTDQCLAWKSFLRPLTPAQVATVMDDLLTLGEALAAAGHAVSMAPPYLTTQASPPRVLAIALFPSGGGPSPAGEIIAQAGWAWLAGLSVSLGPADRATLAELRAAPSWVEADAWAWIGRAVGFQGTPFASVAAARAALPT